EAWRSRRRHSWPSFPWMTNKIPCCIGMQTGRMCDQMHLLPVCFFLFLSKGCASAPSCAMLEMGDRVEIVTKLLRESYLDYPQLCECYGALSAEALWKELEEARMHWRLNETLLGKS